MAAATDLEFCEVQIRAANCHLSLGNVEDALQYFSTCLQSESAICLDRKVVIEASDGLQKAQRVAECMDCSAKLLQQRTSSDAYRALEIISEALSISSYSERLLEMKAEALFMLRKYDEAIQLCEQTLDSAEKNFSSIRSDSKLGDSELVQNSTVRLWRWRLISKSYFYLGRLEEALDLLEKQEQMRYTMENKNVESSIPLAVTVRELLHLKTAGNEAFQSGRYAEAVEHYTAAIACNVESRPFAAICFCNRAGANRALGQITDASADCSIAIALDGSYLKAIYRRATIHEMIRDYGQAANDLERFISLLEKLSEDKANQSGALGRSTGSLTDLREARLRLSTIEEEARNEMPLDLYLILGIEPSGTASDIEKAYRKAALRHHRDKAGQFLARSENGVDGLWKQVAEEVDKDADRLFKMVGLAYTVLSDPAKCSRYDPEFVRVQIRAANCHLSLGKVEDALQYFSTCLQSESAICLGRKIVIEASDGLQKAQRVAECMDRSAKLLQQRTSSDAYRALGIIAEALSISSYSERLLEMKAEALFMLRKYEEVIQLCEQTLDSAEKNFSSIHSDSKLGDSELIQNSTVRLWRWRLISKSYFYLGRLDEALDLLEKQEQMRYTMENSGSNNVESSIPMAVTVRELLHLKTAGNEAFQSGRYAEAVEHYTAAIACNVESRPFAAICFCNRAGANRALGQITDAIADCSIAIALDGNYLKAIYRRATIHEMIRDYGQAANDFERLISVLEKQSEDKANQSGALERSTGSLNCLRQARLRLSTIEEEARNEMPLDLYLILGIEPSGTASDIEKAYRKAALRHHRDKAGQFLARSENGVDGLWKQVAEEVDKDADRLFKMVGLAYTVLSDPAKCSRYDPEFFRVQIRAANCHLSLGEVEDALQYFSKCLQSGSAICLDRKIVIEASDGLQKAQRVAECMDRSAKLLQQRTSSDAYRALGIIGEALSISSYSERLLEMKAEALFMLRKYEEAIQLCEKTLDSAEKNSSSIRSDSKLGDSELIQNSTVRLWRWRLISKSYFYLGRLEEALDLLEKQEQMRYTMENSGSNNVESSIPMAVTVRELLHLKTAGNEAFQSGRYAEAVEHYTAAISCNVESRPFAAICFCNRASANRALGQITDAIADCSIAIALDGSYLKAIYRRATIHEMIRDYGQAANDLERFISLLEKLSEDKANQSGALGRSTGSLNDLRQARLRLSTIEEEARKEMPLDLYLTLGIEPSGTASDIEKAYRKAALRHHRDKAGQFLARSENGDDGLWKQVAEEVDKDADRLFKMVGEAYTVLSDPAKRSRYDPEFVRVQIRAANCHLSLGKVEDALQYFSTCLQSESAICLDRKVVIEASDGLQKAQRVAECMDRSAKLLQQRTSSDAYRALGIIGEALSISSYSERLLEMKAEALFMLRKYEEAIQLCEKTLDSAEKNFSSIRSDSKLGDSEVIKNSTVRLWRWHLISKSYFYLGRLEEALDLLEKQEQMRNTKENSGSKNVESSIPLAGTVRELLLLKTAGNEALQSGRYAEAVVHYTAAISCNVESRPFAAICFCNRAGANRALGRITDAIADCSIAIALDGSYLKAISRRATLHEMIRDYGQAANDLEKLISLHEKLSTDKANQSGALGRSTGSLNDLRQARLRLSTIEEEARKEMPLDMYLILGIEPSGTASDIKKAYRKAALRHHPDKAGQFLARSENGDDEFWKQVAEEVHKDADRLFKIVGEAYTVLSDPAERSRYDLEEETRSSQKSRSCRF